MTRRGFRVTCRRHRSRTKQMQWWNGEGDARYVLTARYKFD